MTIVGEAVFPIATFSGLKRVPLLALSHNALFPALVIGREALMIRVLRRHVLAFHELEAVTCRRGNRGLTFVPKRGIRTFSASFGGRDAALRALRKLRDAGAPLDGEAAALLQPPPPGATSRSGSAGVRPRAAAG